MPACPNCGRPTLRTKDWACQWCGYPLLSRSYKKIDKTFKELQEERASGSKTPSAAPETSPAQTVSELRTAPEFPSPAPKPPPPSELKPPSAPKPPPPPVPEHPPAVLKTPSPPPEPQTPPAPAPQAPLRPEAELEPGPVPPAPLTAPETPPELVAEPPPPELPAEPEPPTLPEPGPPPPTKPEPPPVVVPKLEAVVEGAAFSVDELDALYKADRQAAHARLKDKTIVVKGFVEKVFIRDHIDVRYIVLTGASRKVAWPVRCTFGRENVSSMERLTEGQEVALRGKYDSYGKNIIFKDCSLV